MNPSESMFRMAHTARGDLRTRIGQRGFALIVVLCFVVLLTAVVVAFFSNATIQRQVANSSANGTKADLFARGALDSIVGDLKQEIVDGSQTTTVTTGAVTSTIYTPTASSTGYYPTMIPYRAGSDPSWTNLIKRSAYNIPFHPNGNGYTQAGSSRAANVSTTQPSTNGRYYSISRWNQALLLPPTSTTDFTPQTTAPFVAPSWILVAQDGSDTHVLTAPPQPSATNAIVGRYAYCIYDEGGLLDANVAGYPSTPVSAYASTPTVSQTLYKNAEAYADLLQLTDASGNACLTQPQIDTLVTWRNNATLHQTSQQPTGYASFVTTNPTGFLKTSNLALINGQSDRLFTNRQQLIHYFTNSLGAGVSSAGLLSLYNALQYLGTFTRDLNQPSYVPDTSKPLILAQSSGGNDAGPNSTGVGGDSATLLTPSTDGRINPSFPFVRVANTFMRNAGSAAIVGEPLVKKRFALNRLAWLTYLGPSATRTLNNPNPSGADADIATLEGIYGEAWLQLGTADNIKKYFGLQWGANPAYAASPTTSPELCWTYVNVNASGTINTLNKVAQLTGSSAREPDFIELLKATVSAGSIAKTSTVSGFGTLAYQHQWTIDTSVDFAILQLAANIIDQFDVDGYPTTIYCANGTINNQFVGVENLPYLNRVRVMVLKAAEPKKGTAVGTATTAGAYGGAENDSQGDAPPPVVNTGANTLQDTGIGLGMLYPELWNPHDWNANDVNRTLGNPHPLDFAITAVSDQSFSFEGQVNPAVPGGNFRSFVAIPTLSPGFNERGFVPASYLAQNLFAAAPRTLTEANTIMTFSLPTGSAAMSLFREPTMLFKPGEPSGLGKPLASTYLASAANITAEHLAPFASNGGLLSGVSDPNGFANGDTLLKDPATTSYIGFYLGAFPLHWVGPSGSQNYNVGERNVYAYLPPTNTQLVVDFTYRLKCQDPTGGSYITYNQEDSTFTILNDDLLVADYKGFFDVNAKNIGWNGTIDPRTPRFGMIWSTNFDNNGHYPYIFPPFPDGSGWLDRANGIINSQRAGISAGAATGAINPASYGDSSGQIDWSNWWMPPSLGWYPGTKASTTGGFQYTGFATGYSLRPGLLTQNSVNVINDGLANDTAGTYRFTSNGGTQYYADADSVVRRAMAGYVPSTGTSTSGSSAATTTGLPMATANTAGVTRTTQSASRPLVLNRPFNSVADLGYVFSGTPWKNIDFFTPESGDAALLDVFCINDTDDPNGLVAGKVNLNTRQAPVLQAIIAGAYKDELQTTSTPPSAMAAALAQAIATKLVSRTTSTTGTAGPLRNPGELVGKWVQKVAASGNLVDGSQSYDGFSADLSSVLTDPNDLYIQRNREAAIRALANAGQTRTWNLLVDVVGQVGRYPQNASSLSNFSVEGEQRLWVHLSIDRTTGQVVAKQFEVATE